MDDESLNKSIGEKLSPLFFDRNFGLTTKTEIEALVFYCYLNNKMDNDEDSSDRVISRELGISETKVRNLKRTCFSRYQEQINFPKFLTLIADKNNDNMFFEVIKKSSGDVICKISVKEVVYRDELLAQFNDSRIHYEKKPGSNFVEVSLADTIKFFNIDDSTDRTEAIDNLVDDLQSQEFTGSIKGVFEGMIEDSPIENTLKNFIQLIKN